MIFLPIVGRELRVAARRGGTYWLRVAAAGVALVLGGGMLLLTLVPFGGRSQSGGMMFAALSWLGLLAALGAGLFFTSDCLSEEKREGTLGFLFLTDLRGYDVVLGKLLATSLRSVFPLLAVFPILALTQLLGGVERGQFWRTFLAIGNAAFFSLSAGLLVSAVSRQALKALAGTLGLLLLFLGLGAFTDGMIAQATGRMVPRLSLASPMYAFTSADTGRMFWAALLVNQIVAWSLLALACVLVRRTWQSQPRHSLEGDLLSRMFRSQRASPRGRRLRERLLETTPVTWLLARDNSQRLFVWALALVMFIGFVPLVLLGGSSNNWWAGWRFLGNFLVYGLELWVAASACQFLAEARRSGLLELLLATPLSSREIALGAWRGLVRLFAAPVLVIVCAQFTLVLLGGRGVARSMVAVSGVDWLASVFGIVGVLVALCNLIALGWFGLWMGLTSRNALIATLKTIVFVQIIPWFAIWFVTMTMISLLAFAGGWMGRQTNVSPTLTGNWFLAAFVLGPMILTLLKAIGFWVLTRRKLAGRLREVAQRAIVPLRPTKLPPALPRTA